MTETVVTGGIAKSTFIVDVNGNPLSAASSNIVENNLQTWIRAGQAFIGTTGLVTGPGSTNQTTAYSFFVPNTTTKNILLFSLRAMGGSGTQNHVRTATTDYALGSAVTPSNLKIGGASSVLTNISYANTNQAASGTLFEPVGIPANTTTEILACPILVPSSTAWAIAVFMFLSAANSNWGVTARWIEF